MKLSLVFASTFLATASAYLCPGFHSAQCWYNGKCKSGAAYRCVAVDGNWSALAVVGFVCPETFGGATFSHHTCIGTATANKRLQCNQE